MTFYFYDLETSGRDPRTQRIMQFAGQRTDEDLNPIGDPFVTFIKLADDVLPEPEAILLTGITPQTTQTEGVSEAEFIKLFTREVMQPDTCIVGYNNVRFDDEFMRFTLWRNLYDAYEWQWKDGRSRWDLIDVVRMTRALRPDGINWPTGPDGRPSNRLTELTSENGLDHENAHDALSDVQATIDVAKLLRSYQPKLFDYLQSMCQKKAVAAMVNPEKPMPFVHTSGMISGDNLKTTIMLPLFADLGQATKIIAYDLRFDPEEFADLSVDELKARLFTRQADLGERKRLPLKGIHTNKCPAIAPLGVLDDEAQKRIELTIEQADANRKKLAAAKGFVAKLYDAWTSSAKENMGAGGVKPVEDVDGALYGGGFLDEADKRQLKEICEKKQERLGSMAPVFHDNRLSELFLRYKARNFPESLSEAEHEEWEAYRRGRLSEKALVSFGKDLARLASERSDEQAQFLLQELQLYAESIIPEPAEDAQQSLL